MVAAMQDAEEAADLLCQLQPWSVGGALHIRGASSPSVGWHVFLSARGDDGSDVAFLCGDVSHAAFRWIGETLGVARPSTGRRCAPQRVSWRWDRRRSRAGAVTLPVVRV